MGYPGVNNLVSPRVEKARFDMRKVFEIDVIWKSEVSRSFLPATNSLLIYPC
jgi:hypothetical protein